MARRANYGRVLPTHRWQGLTRWQRVKRWLAAWRPWALLAVLLGGWNWFDGALMEPPAILAGTPETVREPLPICGHGHGHANACVVDGDTLRIGQRRIRVIGIDAPEVHEPQCPAEAALGAAATAELHRLLAQGPFILTGRIDDVRDKYGRELKAITRQRADGSVQSISDDLIASGTVRRYWGGLRGGWC